MYTPTESNYTPTGNGTGIDASITYNNYCANRLPCGLCRLTNSICPLSSGYEWKPTWETTPFYSTTGTVMKEVENNGQTTAG